MRPFSELNNQEQIERAIQEQIKAIEISDLAYTQAEQRYQSIGDWLQRRDSHKLTIFSPDVYTQGSFALGTAIKPLDNSEDYDIDLVCHLKTQTSKYTQKEIKTIFGEELKKYAEEHNMSHQPEESRRCWTMLYASSNDSAGFHLDALPAVSNFSYAEAKSQFEQFKQTDVFQVNITDNENNNYNNISDDWNVSNPKGYAEWFNSKQQAAINRERSVYAQKMFSINASTEDVPQYAIKTPLQQTIQFLKRHRDIYFQNNSDVKPISIIITTLVAQTYLKEHSRVVDIVEHFLKNFSKFIIMDESTIIPNPVNRKENFADKWSEYPERKESFFQWTQQLRSDFNHLAKSPSYEKLLKHVEDMLTCSQYNRTYQKQETSNNLPVMNFDVSHKQILNFPIVEKSQHVNVTAIYRKKYGGFRSIVLSSGALIGKDYRITFKVHDKHIRGKKKYYWQVVNTGHEAICIHNCPRGDFYDGETKRGGKTRIETTLYTGEHWVQCFIVQNDQCIAKSPEFIVNIQ